MTKFRQMLQLDLFSYWSSPANTVCLLIIVCLGILLGPLNVTSDSQLASHCWSIAGKTYQYAGSFAGLIACIEAAALFQKDKQAMRFELLITSGHSTFYYTISKIASLIIPLFITGIILGALAQLCCYTYFGLTDPFAFLAGLIVLYLPLISIGVLFGYFFSLTTNSQSFVLALFLCIWLAGFLPFPSITGLFDLSGESLYVAFFDLPMDDLNYENYQNRIPISVWEEAIHSLKEQKYYGKLCLVVFLITVIALLVLTIFTLNYKWQKNAEGLLPYGQALSGLTCSINSRASAVLKASRIWYLLFVIAVLFIGNVFLPFSDDPKIIALFFSEPLPAICITIAFCSIYSYPIRLGVYELQQAIPNNLKYLVFKITITLLAVFLINMIQAFQWENILQLSFTDIIIGSLTASLLFLMLTNGLLIFIKNKAALIFLLITIWLLLQLPSFKNILLSLSIGWLYPFQISLNGEASITLAIIASIAYIGVTIAFIKKSCDPKSH